MKFKIYQILKTKSLLKKKSLLLFASGINQKAQSWVKTEQGLQKANLKYYKIYNKTIKKAIKKSKFLNFVHLIGGPIFLLLKKNRTDLDRNILLKETLFTLKFKLLALKLNNKVYSISQLKNMNSLNNNKENTTILYQFLLINIKLPQIFKKISK